MTVKVCTIQGFTCELNVERNVSKWEEIIEGACQAHQPDFILLSEMATAPMFTSDCHPDYFSLAEHIPGKTTEVFSKLSKKYNCYIIVPMFEKVSGGIYHNSAVLLGPDGEIVVGESPSGKKYNATRKLHIPASYDLDGNLRSNEKFFFTPGPDIVTHNTKFGKVGIIICWDKRFTELWRIMGLEECKIVFNPIATWGDWRGQTFKDELKVMAMTNQYFVVGCSRAGSEDIGYQKNYVGGSHIINPLGEVVTSTMESQEGKINIGEVDLDLINKVKVTTPIYRDRRPELYNRLLEQ